MLLFFRRLIIRWLSFLMPNMLIHRGRVDAETGVRLDCISCHKGQQEDRPASLRLVAMPNVCRVILEPRRRHPSCAKMARDVSIVTRWTRLIGILLNAAGAHPAQWLLGQRQLSRRSPPMVDRRRLLAQRVLLRVCTQAQTPWISCDWHLSLLQHPLLPALPLALTPDLTHPRHSLSAHTPPPLRREYNWRQSMPKDCYRTVGRQH